MEYANQLSLQELEEKMDAPPVLSIELEPGGDWSSFAFRLEAGVSTSMIHGRSSEMCL